MKNNFKLIFGIIIVVIIVAGAYFMAGGDGFSITGAAIGAKECVGSEEISFFNACTSWKESSYGDKPSTLRILTDDSARQLCDRLLSKYKAC